MILKPLPEQGWHALTTDREPDGEMKLKRAPEHGWRALTSDREPDGEMI